MDASGGFEPPISTKIVMIGNSCVGKTSLVNSWISSPNPLKTTPTVGSNHHRKIVTINDEMVDVCVWDTAGQEQFRSLTPLYTRSAAVAIAVTSVIDKESFETLDMWIDLVAQGGDICPPIVLAVSKVDLATNTSPTQEEIENTYGSKFQAIFFTSALTGENVDSLFMEAAKQGVKFLKSKCQVPQDLRALDSMKGAKENGNCC